VCVQTELGKAKRVILILALTSTLALIKACTSTTMLGYLLFLDTNSGKQILRYKFGKIWKILLLKNIVFVKNHFFVSELCANLNKALRFIENGDRQQIPHNNVTLKAKMTGVVHHLYTYIVSFLWNITFPFEILYVKSFSLVISHF